MLWLLESQWAVRIDLNIESCDEIQDIVNANRILCLNLKRFETFI